MAEEKTLLSEEGIKCHVDKAIIEAKKFPNLSRVFIQYSEGKQPWSEVVNRVKWVLDCAGLNHFQIHNMDIGKIAMKIANQYVNEHTRQQEQRSVTKTMNFGGAIPTEQLTNKEETIMNPTVKLIETKTFICGIESSQIEDNTIYCEIARAEENIKELSKIKNKPEKLKAKIKEMEAEIAELVKFVDNRS